MLTLTTICCVLCVWGVPSSVSYFAPPFFQMSITSCPPGCEVVSIPIDSNYKVTAQAVSDFVDSLVEQEAGEQSANCSGGGSQDEDYGKACPLKGIILSSPSNPTGAMLSADEIRDMVKVTFSPTQVCCAPSKTSHANTLCCCVALVPSSLILLSFDIVLQPQGGRRMIDCVIVAH